MILASLPLSAGCGGGDRDALEKQVSALRDEVARLRATQAALGERMDAVDIERGAFAKKAGSAGPSASPPPAPLPPNVGVATSGDRPDLAVVKLSPNEGDGDADVDRGDPARIVVRAVGDPAAKPPPTLSNKNLGARPKKSAAVTAPKKDGDARPNAQP